MGKLGIKVNIDSKEGTAFLEAFVSFRTRHEISRRSRCSRMRKVSVKYSKLIANVTLFLVFWNEIWKVNAINSLKGSRILMECLRLVRKCWLSLPYPILSIFRLNRNGLSMTLFVWLVPPRLLN